MESEKSRKVHVPLQYVSHMSCTLCESDFSLEELGESLTCPSCGEKGILDIVYDYQEIKNNFTIEDLRSNTDQTIFRYLPLLPITQKPNIELLNVGNTPLYKALRFEQVHEGDIYIKDDGLNPTSSMKDRASLIAVVKALELGLDTICCSSTGNAASSLAGNSAKAGLDTVIFVPERAPSGKLAQLVIYGAKLIIIAGDYKATFNMSKEVINAYGYYNRNAAINPYLVEGKKTVALEIAEQLDFNIPDWVSISVGDGCSIAGVYKGFYDLLKIGFIKRLPRILGVQATGCKPIYDAFYNDGIVKEAEEDTLADSIAVGIPRNPIKALKAVKETQGEYVHVSDDEILDTIAYLGRCEGIYVEPASGAAFAGVRKAIKEGVIKSEESIVIINTGNGLKDIKSGLKAVALPTAIKPEIREVERMLL